MGSGALKLRLRPSIYRKRAMIQFLSVPATFLAILAWLVLPASADTPSYRGEFTISFLGLPVASIDFDSRVDGDRYTVGGKVSSAGLGAFFYDTRGTLTATGRIIDRIQSESFRAKYDYDGKPTLVEIGFRDGNVVRVVNEPPLRKRKNWVPIEPADLKSVVDPLAASLVKSDRLEKVCDGGARMFDGELRADLSLSFVETGKMSVKGFDGPTVTCRLKFTPVAGYRKGRKSLEYLKSKSRIMVTFAQIGETGVYAPIHATIGTQIGTITVRARRFEALQAS